MKDKIVASLLAIILFATTIGVFFTSEALTPSAVSVVMKEKKGTTLLAMKNNSDTPVYSVELKVSDGEIRFVKSKGWDRQKIDASTVMIETDDRPITQGHTQIIIMIVDNNHGIKWKAYDAEHDVISSNEYGSGAGRPVLAPSVKEKIKEMAKPSCKGNAACFAATVTAIVDGDTIDVSPDDVSAIRIRLALTNTPEEGQPLYNKAMLFTADLCRVDLIVGIDEDDGQTEGSYDRMIAKVYCQNKVLNAELLGAGLATIDTRFCNESEFADESWAQEFGC